MKSALLVILTDNAGGAVRIATPLANALARRSGWRVQLMIMSRRRAPSFTGVAVSDQVDRRFGPFDRERFGFAVLAARLIGQPRHDLIFTTHVHTNGLVSVLRATGLLSARRVVARETTTVFHRFTGIRRAAFRLFYGLYGAQDLIIAQTAFMADHVRPHVRANARSRLAVLPNPVDVSAIGEASVQPLAPDVARRLAGRTNILVCGRLIGVKRPLVALDVFARLRAARPDEGLQLVFMGEGPLRSDLEAEAALRGLEKDVLLLGLQPNPYPVMRACRFGLLTSSREGFPNVLLEMMACGLRKIVTTPCAGDLDALDGVAVTRGFAATELADALLVAMEAGEDCSDRYRAVVAGRSIDGYLDAVLGELA